MKLRQMMAMDPPTDNEDYQSLYSDMLNSVVEEKGGSKELYSNLLNKIAYLESGLDPSIKQLSGGPGRGKYQFETGVGYEQVLDKDGKPVKATYKGTSNRIYYAAARTKKYLEKLGKPVPKYISEIVKNQTGDASTLTETQQDILAIGDLRMGRVDLADFASGKITGKDIYIKDWWVGKDEEHKQKLIKRWDEKEDAFRKTSHYMPVGEQNNNWKTQQGQAPLGVVQDNLTSTQEQKPLTEKRLRQILEEERNRQTEKKEQDFISAFQQLNKPKEEQAQQQYPQESSEALDYLYNYIQPQEF